MHRFLTLKDCLGLNKVDRFYYEDAPTNTPPSGSAPAPTVPPANNNPSGFDPSKLSDEEFAKIFDDNRLFKHDRFKSLADAKKERDDLKAAQSKAEEDRMKANQEFEKLAQTKEQEAKTWQEKYNTSLIDTAIVQEAYTKGARDLEAVKALINRGDIKIDGEGKVIGAAEAVESLAKSKEYLFTNNPQNPIGRGTAPANGNNQVQTFTMSQLNDARFFRANQAAIKAAMAAGMIVDDRGQGQGPRR